MAIIKAQDGTSDPIITRMVAEDKVPELGFVMIACANTAQGTVVQETQSPHHVPLALFVLHGCGDDIWVRLATDRHTTILATLQQM